MSIAILKELRDISGAGISDCKKALQETNGNIEEAVKWLRERGIAKAAKKASAVAAEGVTCAHSQGNRAVIFELNSQTDFVSKNHLFQELLVEIKEALIHSNAHSLEQALEVNVKGMILSERLVNATAQIGENIVLRRFFAINKTNSDTFGVYNHSNNRISSVIVLEGTNNEEAAKGLAMHLAAMNPKFLNESQVDQEWLANEKDVLTAQALQEGKPIEIVEKMIMGRVSKMLKEVCFVDQTYILTGDQTVAHYAKSVGGKISLIKRLEVGEGIQVEVTDFAAEVAAQMR